ncbi:deaminase [Amycolatopsis minnesotensis]|uniref:CMP/dCMP-type deaminase domain-containing protein n=1 Tax=Amycolatopsis minnesotensis TaxID=337894 RepID=A0ABP5D5I3_9PSEU
MNDDRWMQKAVELSWECPPSEAAFAVGAVIVDANGDEIATGYSRETDSKVHAEEAALAKVPADDPRLPGATMYSTLEPCSQRASRPTPCAQLIIKSGIKRCVIAWREPDLFVTGVVGVEQMRDAGVEVVELPAFAEAALAPNKHLNLGGS